MNNLGEERIAIKRVNVVTTVLKKKWNECDISDKNDAITQETLKQPRWSKSTKRL